MARAYLTRPKWRTDLSNSKVAIYHARKNQTILLKPILVILDKYIEAISTKAASIFLVIHLWLSI